MSVLKTCVFAHLSSSQHFQKFWALRARWPKACMRSPGTLSTPRNGRPDRKACGVLCVSSSHSTLASLIWSCSAAVTKLSTLEAQQQHFSYRAMLSAIAQLHRALLPWVSHKYGTICCRMGYRTDMSVQNKTPKRWPRTCWGLLGWPRKYHAMGGIAAILSQYRAMRGH